MDDSPVVFRDRTWPLKGLTESEYSFWEENGYVAVKGCVPLSLCRDASAAVHEFVGADRNDRKTWYRNELDIYEDVTRDGLKPKHGPCGMVQLYHHDSLWKIRQEPSVHACFSDVYGTKALWVTTDRAHFKPPEDSHRYPKWSNPGKVHGGLHWDVSTKDLPVPMAVQGVVYLEKTTADMGALRVVPKSHRRIVELSSRPHSHHEEEVAVEGEAGTLVMWHSATLHGPGRNTVEGGLPRISAYVAMLPVDASPFNGGRSRDAPLSLADAGTLDYDDDEKRPTLKRLDRKERELRWRHRLPLLDQDPREDQLENGLVVGGGGGGHNTAAPPPPPQPFGGLTPLGRKLVGVDSW